MKKKDVTKLVDFQNNDDELLPITKCICGTEYTPWEFVISIYDDMPYECPECGAKLYFEIGVRVFEIHDED